jgi:arylsulfatase A-like enzyme
MNIILIISDTLRADYLGCYGNETVRTPNLDALAAHSMVFDRYYAASFPTMPARADLFLGRWALTYMKWERYPDASLPLPMRLAEKGYLPVGVVDTPFYQTGGMGYDRGFAHFYDMECQPTYHRQEYGWLFQQPRLTEFDYCAPMTFHQAEQVLDRVYAKPFFLLVDTWDPHEPWDPPPWYVKPYLPDWDGRLIEPPYNYLEASGQTEADLQIARACYMAEITMVDRWVGRLIERVESLGIADDTAILFLSDHGFYFGEHGGLFGKMIRRQIDWSPQPEWLRSPLYEELVHVPLLVHLPGSKPGRTSALVSAVDIMPTILDMAGIDPRDDASIHGRSFLPVIKGKTAKGRDFVISSNPLVNPGPKEMMRLVDNALRAMVEYQPVTITDPQWSLLYSAAGEPIELYDVTQDPRQTKNVADQNRDVVTHLHKQFVSLLEQVGTRRALVEPRSQLG